MRRHGPWFKLWYEWGTDPKIQRMSESDQRRHVMWMCLRCEGVPFDLDDYAWRMRTSRDDLERTFETFKQLGLVGESGDIPAWADRQGDSDADRARRHRERVSKTEKSRDGHVTVTLRSRDRHASDADAESESDPPVVPQGTTPPDSTASPGTAPTTQPTDDCPHDEIVALYHEMLPALPRVASWGRGSRAKLRARWREAAERRSLDWWRELFGRVSRSPFLLGQCHGTGGRPPFTATLGWLVCPENLEKVVNGQYEHSSQRRKHQDPPVTYREPKLTIEEQKAQERARAIRDGYDPDAPDPLALPPLPPEEEAKVQAFVARTMAHRKAAH